MVGNVANDVKIDVKFKSSGSGGTAWSALKMILSESYEEVGGSLLTEQQILSENFILDWVKKWLSKIWEKLVRIAKTTFTRLLEILGLKINVKIISDYGF